MAKDLVTVKGIMDPKALPGMLREKLKRPLEVVLPKKENANDKKEKDDKGGEIKENGSCSSGGSNKQKGGDAAAGVAAGAEGQKMGYYYGVCGCGNTPYYVRAPQYFSDENPNACSVM